MNHYIIIGLGSNIGDRELHLRQAIEELRPWVDDLKESAVYASPAMLPEDAPEEWDMPYLNMAISGYVELEAQEVLKKLKQIEADIGGERKDHWGPRKIDLDILAVDQKVIDEEHLRIPHPGFLERAFVLLPVRDIAPHWVYPRPSLCQGKTVQEIASQLVSDVHKCTLYKSTLPGGEA